MPPNDCIGELSIRLPLAVMDFPRNRGHIGASRRGLLEGLGTDAAQVTVAASSIVEDFAAEHALRADRDDGATSGAVGTSSASGLCKGTYNAGEPDLCFIDRMRAGASTGHHECHAPQKPGRHPNIGPNSLGTVPPHKMYLAD